MDAAPSGPHDRGRAPGPDEGEGWEAVRDSWVDDIPTPAPRSEPPPLPASVREAPGRRAPADAVLAERMLGRLAAGDYEGSLVAAEALLRRLPRDADALDCAAMSRGELQVLFTARLGGDLDSVPRTAARDVLATVTLDAFTALVVSRIDGGASLRDIAFAPDTSPVRALRVLADLYLRGAISLGG